MLKGLDPILNADVLHALKSMGHGDDLIIADTNFPSDSIARQTVYGKLLKLENVTAGRAAEAILSLLPLDSFVPHPRRRSTGPRASRRQWARSSVSLSMRPPGSPTW